MTLSLPSVLKPLIILLMLACFHCADPVLTSPSSVSQAAIETSAASPQEAEDLDPTPNRVRVRLVAAPHGLDQWAYNEQVPGPTIRARVGDMVTVELVNHLPNPTTIHWHGVGVPFAMDGVPWMTSPVPPMGTFEYTFEVTRPGTFWYHPHFDTYHQVDLGLYGAFVVEEPPALTPNEGPDRDLILIFDQPHEADNHDDGPQHIHGLIAPDTPWLVNGLLTPTVALEAGERVRVRMVNASNSGYLHLKWPDMQHIGGDQGLWPELRRPESVLLGPGDRGEFEWLGTPDQQFAVEALPYTLNGGAALGLPREVLGVRVAPGTDPPPPPIAWPFEPHEPTLDPGWTDAVYVFSGSAEAQAWMINGETFPDITIYEANPGDEVYVEVRNLSATEHPFHMHGHAFEVLSVDGVAPLHRRIEDTVNVGIRQILRLRFVATRPGDWMVHCHILPHSDGGMMTVFRVLEP